MLLMFCSESKDNKKRLKPKRGLQPNFYIEKKVLADSNKKKMEALIKRHTEREVFFINQLSTAHVVEYSKTSADFTINHQYTIEVGGRSKDGKQIAGVANSFIASADEEYVLGNKIPLWLFGFCISIVIAQKTSSTKRRILPHGNVDGTKQREC